MNQELALALKAKAKCIWLETYEEEVAIREIKETLNMTRPEMEVISFSIGFGRRREPLVGDTHPKQFSPGERKTALGKMLNDMVYAENLKSTMVVVRDGHVVLGNPQEQRAVRDFVEVEKVAEYCPIVVISPFVKIPAEQEKIWSVIKLETPSKKAISGMINSVVKQLEQKAKVKATNYIAPDKDEIKKCIDYAFGLTTDQIKHLLRMSVLKYDNIDPVVFHEAKLEAIKTTGMLQYIESDVTMDELGGNDNFKKWIDDVKISFSEDAKDFGVEMPKGYLALGIPGTCKSHAAAIIANELKLPLVKFEMSATMHSHVGQSERNMAEAINMIKSCSPCVLYIDEVEKVLGGAVSSNKVDGGTLMRVMGQLLELLSSKEGEGIFTIMTSNDVAQLPPELTRSGRIDTMWYFGLPTEDERREIFKIHFRDKLKLVDDIMMNECVKVSDELTGAEIKEMVKVMNRKAFARYKTTNKFEYILEDVENSKKEIIPVMKSYREKIMMLENYVQDRARFASEKKKEKIETKKDIFLDISDLDAD